MAKATKKSSANRSKAKPGKAGKSVARKPAKDVAASPQSVASGTKPSAYQLLLEDPAARTLLTKRAAEMKSGHLPVNIEEAGCIYIKFRLGAAEHYGVLRSVAEEIIYAKGLAPVPCTPRHVAGIVNRRGDLITVLNLKEFFRVEEGGMGELARIIIVREQDITVGLLVDEVIGEAAYQAGELEEAIPSDRLMDLSYVEGVHDGRTTILQTANLLRDPALVVDQHAETPD